MSTFKDYGLDDPSLLELAEHLAPDLMFALRVGKAAQGLKFPITSHSDLHELFDGNEKFIAANVEINKGQFDSVFPASLFPIESPSELVTRVYAVLAGTHASTREAGLRAIAPKLTKDSNGTPLVGVVVGMSSTVPAK